MNATGQWAVITGASSGIGREFARLFAQNGVNVVLAARDEAALGQLAEELRAQHGVEALVYAGDLSDLTIAEGLYDFTCGKRLNVQFLVNNAGFGDYGLFSETEWKKELAMINLNITALTYLSKLFAVDMKQSGAGKIVNLASTAAFVPGPRMAVYYATKAYVLSLSQAVNSELRGSGVTVTALCPGPTASGFARSAHAENGALFRGRLPTAAQVAAYGYQAMLAGKPVAIHGRKNRLLIFLTRFTPRQLLTAAINRAQN